MAEPQDAILPILKNIQDRLSSFERRTEGSLLDMKSALLDQGEKLEAMQGLLHYHLGLTTTHTHQIEELQKQMKDAQARLSALEGPRS